MNPKLMSLGVKLLDCLLLIKYRKISSKSPRGIIPSKYFFGVNKNVSTPNKRPVVNNIQLLLSITALFSSHF